jgi:hypothetical protein
MQCYASRRPAITRGPRDDAIFRNPTAASASRAWRLRVPPDLQTKPLGVDSAYLLQKLKCSNELLFLHYLKRSFHHVSLDTKFGIFIFFLTRCYWISLLNIYDNFFNKTGRICYFQSLIVANLEFCCRSNWYCFFRSMQLSVPRHIDDRLIWDATCARLNLPNIVNSFPFGLYVLFWQLSHHTALYVIPAEFRCETVTLLVKHNFFVSHAPLILWWTNFSLQDYV